MRRRITNTIGLAAALVIMAVSAASAGTMLPSDTFEDGEFSLADVGGSWTSVNHVWSVENGRALARAVGDRHIGYAVMASPISSGFKVQADVTMSSTFRRAAPALVTNFRDAKNNMVTKLEVTEGHPTGMLAVGDQRSGEIRSTRCRVDHLGLRNGQTYRLTVTRSGSIVTGAVYTSPDQSLIASCSVSLSSGDLAAYGSATRHGLRVKIRSDEDDGGSRWDNFSVLAS